MSRLTPEERRAAREEAEYSQNNSSGYTPQSGTNATPAGPQRPPSAYERIVSATKNVGRKLHEIDNSPTGQAIRKHAQMLNAQDSGRARGAQGSHPMAGYARFSNDAPAQSQPVNQGSALHPGHRIIVVEGSVIASARMPGSAPTEPRRREPPRGGLGAIDTGFDNDRGL